jgi:hypothetical protein
MAYGEKGVVDETEIPLRLWEEELATRAERVDVIREARRDILAPVLIITDSAPSCFGAFRSTEAVEVYFAGLNAAIKRVMPAVIGGNSGQIKIGDVVQFFSEVCGVPEDTTRNALTEMTHDGQVVYLENHSLEAPQPEVI